MAEYTTKDAVEFAVNNNSGEFKNAIHDILANRVQSAIEVKKVDVTANFMSPKDDEVAVDEPQEVEVPEDETT
tara:strand:+ start:1821 stop:2039 length:219 start_codon:yes stop_codon:yes gene_type:complete